MKSAILLSLIIVLCAQTPSETRSINQASAQKQEFINVEGTGLNPKMDEAIKQARAGARAESFWTAYSFDVRSGVAVDYGYGQFSGTIRDYGGTNVFSGTSNGVTVETRNLGVFLLRERGRGAISRVEIYNLDREREYSGYSVYWLGRAGNQESLDFLKSLALSNADAKIAERAALAIGLHDDRRTGAILKELISQSSEVKVRGTAIYWLGQAGGEQEFLAALARNEREAEQTRKQAAYAISASRDAAALSILQNLYRSVASREVKESLIGSAARVEDQKAAVGFLSKIAETDPDHGLRKYAISRLGRFEGAEAFLARLAHNEQENEELRLAAVSSIGRINSSAALKTLQDLYGRVSNQRVKKQIISVVARNKENQPVAFLSRIAKNDSDMDMRKYAVSRLGRMPGSASMLTEMARNERESIEIRREAVSALRRTDEAAALSTLESIYGSISDQKIKHEIISAVARTDKQDEAADFLIKVARNDPDLKLREDAITRIGRMGCQSCLQAINEIVNDNRGDTSLQIHSVRALSRAKESEAVTMLINIARNHPSIEVRREVVRRLRYSKDERAQEFLKELISR